MTSEQEVVACIWLYVVIFIFAILMCVFESIKEEKKMAREGLMDDAGYHGFDECSRQEECNKEAYEQGRDDMAEETYIDLKDALDNLNNDMSLEKTVEFVAKVKEITEGLRWQNKEQKK